VFNLDVAYSENRNDWYDPDFNKEQPYMGFGVKTDEALHPMRDGVPFKNLYATGSILGNTRPEFGSASGGAILSAFHAVDRILSGR